MMTSQIWKSVDFTRRQKSRYLENEIFFLQIRKFINSTSRAILFAKNTFVAEVTFKALFCGNLMQNIIKTELINFS